MVMILVRETFLISLEHGAQTLAEARVQAHWIFALSSSVNIFLFIVENVVVVVYLL